MADIIIKLLIGMGMRLLTERFLGRMLIHGCRSLSDKTSNKLDDSMVDDLAEALGQGDLKKAA